MKNAPTFRYDASEEIMYVGFANLAVETEDDVREAFAAVRAFWRAKCYGKKVYTIVDYTNFKMDPALTEFYAQYVKGAVEDLTITTVRYTEDIFTRATLRRVGMTMHRPSNLYFTKDEAVSVVRALKARQMAIAAEP